MANLPPSTGPSGNVTTTTLTLSRYATITSTFGSEHPVPPDQRLQATERSMLQTQSLPSLHHGFPAPSRTGPPVSHLQLPPLDTRFTRPHAVAGLPNYAAVTDDASSKRRRLEDDQSSRTQPGYHHTFADSSAKHSTPDIGDSSSRASGSRNAVLGLYAPTHKADQDVRLQNAPHLTANNNECCQTGCAGQHCTNVRKLLADLITEITERDITLSDSSSADLRHHASPLPHLHKISLLEALEWAVWRLRWNNGAIKKLITSQTPGQPNVGALGPTTADHASPPVSSGQMKRLHESYHADQDMSSRTSVPNQGPPRQPWGSAATEHWREPDPHSSQRRFSSSSTPGVAALQSPPPNPLSAAARMLPSPSSMSLPVPTALGSPALSAMNSSAAQAAHLQDLQHQVSVKSLSLSTLKREYDSLLQKLERQRVKSAALEKKFEVSDAEINGLLEDKERLEKQVEILEKQLEEASLSRDESRKQSSEQAAQYMKILDMGNQLQKRAVEDRKTWEKEKETLAEKIKELEAAERSHKSATRAVLMGHASPVIGPTRSGSGFSTPNTSKRMDKSTEPSSSKIAASPVHANFTNLSGAPDAHQQEMVSQIHALEQEVQRLRRQVEVLEAALAASKREGEIIREAALRLANIDAPTQQG